MATSKKKQIGFEKSEEFAVLLERARLSKWASLGSQQLTEIPEEVLSLPNLEGIDLSDNLLRSLPDKLRDLPNLRYINVVGNPIEHLPDRPGLVIDGPIYLRCRGGAAPKNTRDLVIGPDTPEEGEFWASELQNLKGIGSLTVGKWSILIGDTPPEPGPALRKVLDSLKNLDFLEKLSIRGLALESVPRDIQQLRRLKSLNLSGLGLRSLPDWIAELPLESLAAVDNKISSLPGKFRELKGLKSLLVPWNPLDAIPEVVWELPSLERLDVQSCGIREIPAAILGLPHLKTLHCSENPLVSPPAEVAKKGLDAIRDYWRQRADTGVDYLCEAKLIILGEAGAGKTSLARKIENPKYKLREREPSTEGIDVIRYEFPSAIRTREGNREEILKRDFQVNIWDFGGQEIYHATHQFFLTRRSVYVLVCDDRKEDTDFSYWLHVVELLSDGSPLFIVQNEKQDRTRDINVAGLRARFANLRAALATNLDTNRGLDQVVQAIRKELEGLPHVGVGLPATWKRVREALEKDKRDFMGLAEYLDLCQRHGFTRREDKLQLSGYLHDLGICLHFQDDSLLKNTVILKPSWGTDAVYRVLDDDQVIAARGRFTQKDLKRIWSEAKYKGMHDELLKLMMRFQLCYALEDGKAYIAPQLLSSEQPPYPWSPAGGLVVRYQYGFLPKGILTRFIVAMNHLIADNKLVWKTGVVLQRAGSRAEVIEEYAQRRIRVRAQGPDAYGLLAIVDDQMERLHAGFSRLQYERYLPCPCSECQGKAEPFGFGLEDLKKMASKGQQIQCHTSGEMVDAGRLLRDILPGAVRPTECEVKDSQARATPAVITRSPEVFVSYAWTSESCAIVDRLQDALEKQGFRLLRDREDMRYRDSIRDFMKRLGQGRCVVAVISEKYLKSENCMFEMLEIAKAKGLRERIFPIVLSDANIYKATGRVRYVRHWEDEIQALDEALKGVRGDNLTKLQEDLNLYSEIRRLFDGIADTLRDMNALTPDQHQGSDFQTLIENIRAQT